MVTTYHHYAGRGFYSEGGEGKQNKETGGGVVDVQAVAFPVLIQIFMVNVFESVGL